MKSRCRATVWIEILVWSLKETKHLVKLIDTGLLGIGARAFFIIFGMGSAVGTAFGKKDLKDNFGFKKY